MRTISQTETEQAESVSAVPAAIAETQVTPDEIVRMFSSRKPAERMNAERALQDVGPAP